MGTIDKSGLGGGHTSNRDVSVNGLQHEQMMIASHYRGERQSDPCALNLTQILARA